MGYFESSRRDEAHSINDTALCRPADFLNKIFVLIDREHLAPPCRDDDRQRPLSIVVDARPQLHHLIPRRLVVVLLGGFERRR